MSDADPHHIDADLDPTLHFDADPDPSFQIKAQIGSYSIYFGLSSANLCRSGSGSSLSIDPDPAYHCDPDPDPIFDLDPDQQHCSKYWIIELFLTFGFEFAMILVMRFSCSI